MVLSNDKPVGKDGCMANEVALPPDVDGVVEVIVWLSERVIFSVEYVMLETITSLIVMLIVVDLDPAELFAQTVYTAPASTTLGVPEMVPVLLSKFSPEGKVALISHEVTLPDVLVFENEGDTGLIALPLIAVMFA